ncbi:hypothetical protein ACHAXR_009153 [Thalassiosira sp. AJA248-18]
MYADGSAPEVDCDRFPSCECGPSSDTVTVPPAPAEEDFPYTKPEFRYEAFSELSPTAQGIAIQELSYMEVTWNNHGLAPIEKQRWSTLSSNEREGAQQLGYDEDQWDCFINHYKQYTWDELGEKGVQKHYEALGWTQGHWGGTTGEVAYAETKWWDQFTDNEKKAANALCYFQQNWDEVDLTPNTSYFPHPMPDFRYVPWGELDAVTKNTAAGLLNYTEELWDNLGTSVAEKNTFRNLDAIERKGALELGFYIHTWDCFMNHYRSLFWSTLSDDLKVDIETLGWTEAMWCDESDELPSSKSKPWIDLTPDEKAAATRLCYFQETWDDEPITKWYDYEAPPGSTSSCDVDKPCDKEFSSCTDGTTESCCGETYDSFRCDCMRNEDGALAYVCMFTDACYGPCETTVPETKPGPTTTTTSPTSPDVATDRPKVPTDSPAGGSDKEAVNATETSGGLTQEPTASPTQIPTTEPISTPEKLLPKQTEVPTFLPDDTSKGKCVATWGSLFKVAILVAGVISVFLL